MGAQQSGPPIEAHDNGAPAFGYVYRFVDAEFDELAVKLRVAGQDVTVERLPLAVLAELLQRPHETVTRDELLDKFWPDLDKASDHALTIALSKLRKALGPEAEKRIERVPRIGYRFIGPVERIAIGRKASAEVDLAAGQPVPARPDMQLDRPLGTRPHAPVWLARSTSTKALRVYKFATDGEALSTLKREYTVCRMLSKGLGDRGDFAKLLGVNFETAPFFLEYEYGGLDLPAWAQQGGLSGQSVAARIDFFLQIARAVFAAHGLGVLHKDIKPANILVTDTGEGPSTGSGRTGVCAGPRARLTDFGSSRVIEPSRLAELGVTALGMTLTQAADTSGTTPLYLAPELLAGQPPTIASDVYALGLVLYQLLVGDFRRPMSTGWQRDIDDELLVEDLTAATEGRPEARIASVAELIRRLSTLDARREERERAKHAQRAAAEAAELLRRTRARRPWLAAAFASLVLGLGASLWFHGQSIDALAQAEQASARAQAINDFMNKDVLQSADVLRASTHKTVSMFDVLERASARATARFDQQPLTEASVRRQLGDIYLRMQYMQQADREFARALELLEPRVRADDAELLAARFGAAQTAVGFFRPDEAVRKLARAEDAAGRDALASTTDLARRAARARVEVMLDAQRPQEALAAAQRLVELSDALAGHDDIALRFEARQRLGEVHLRLGDKVRADALFAELARPPYSEGGVGDVLLSRARLRHGRELINEGRLDEAEAVLGGVRDAMTRAFGPHELYAGGANLELTDVYAARGDFAKALDAAQAAQAAFATSLGETHYMTQVASVNLAAVELETGQAARALEHFDQARPHVEGHPYGAPLAAGIQFGRAKAMTRLGRADEGLTLLETVDATLLAESSWGPRDFHAQLQAEKAHALAVLGRKDEAKPLLADAIREMEVAGSYPWLIDQTRERLHRAGGRR
jgi:eukaryotic-like serine/threonine-protein kinase